MSYVFSYRKSGGKLWKKEVVEGHKYEQGLDRLVLFFKGNAIQEIAHWVDYDVKLGTDWVKATKKANETNKM